MKLTLTLHSTKIKGSKQFTLRQLVSAFVLLMLVFVVSSRSTTSERENIARIQLAQRALVAEQSQLHEIEQRVDMETATYAAEIAKLKHVLGSLEDKVVALSQKAKIELPEAQLALTNEELEYSTSLVGHIQQLQQDTEDKQRQLALLEKVYKGLHIEEQVQVSGRPVKWGWLSSRFGLRSDPFTGRPALHKGVDFAGKANGDVVSTGAGVITWAGERYGYGLLVEIDHGNGLVTRYGHNSQLKVSVGDVVTRGAVIAAMGSTGRSTGVHVHYEVLKNGKQVDPLAYLN